MSLQILNSGHKGKTSLYWHQGCWCLSPTVDLREACVGFAHTVYIYIIALILHFHLLFQTSATDSTDSEESIWLPLYTSAERVKVVTHISLPCGPNPNQWIQTGAALFLKQQWRGVINKTRSSKRKMEKKKTNVFSLQFWFSFCCLCYKK